MGRTALVVSGGGAKGAFAVGAVEYMIKRLGIEFDLYAGTSTGALVTSCLAAGKLDELVTYYASSSTATMLTQKPAGDVVRSESVLGIEPLKRALEGIIDQAAAGRVLAGTTPLFLATVSLQTGELVYFHTSADPRIDAPARQHRLQSRAELVSAILASASVPVMLPAVQVLKHPLDPAVPPLPPDAPPNATVVPDQFTDGGVREFAPLGVAIDNGASDVYVVVLSPIRRTRRNVKFTRALQVLPRTIDLLTEDVAENDLAVARKYNLMLTQIERLRAELVRGGADPMLVDRVFTQAGPPFDRKRLVNFYVIAPEQPLLKGDSLDFTETDMARMITAGRRRAAAVLGGGAGPVV
jgi:predicted acylesterase/phospholipase RssA